MLLRSDASAEPGVVRRVENPVRSEQVVDHMAWEDDLIADRQGDQRQTRKRKRSRAWSGRKVAEPRREPLDGRLAAEWHIFAEGYEMVFRVSGQDSAGRAKSLDRVEISGAIFARYTVRHTGEQHPAVW